MATGSGDGRDEEGGARVGVGAAVTRGCASDESLVASEHAAVTMIRKTGTNRDETTSASLGISITCLVPYHSFTRQGVPTWFASIRHHNLVNAYQHKRFRPR